MYGEKYWCVALKHWSIEALIYSINLMLNMLILIFQDILESSGANNFFTLVRYNPPELLEDYNYFKKLEKQEKDRQRMSVEDDMKTLSSSTSEEAETAEDIIFTLFGPRVWEHNGELTLLTLQLYNLN